MHGYPEQFIPEPELSERRTSRPWRHPIAPVHSDPIRAVTAVHRDRRDGSPTT